MSKRFTKRYRGSSRDGRANMVAAQVVSAGPNDVVVLRVPYPVCNDEQMRLRDQMAHAFPYNRCAILEAGVEIQVVSARARRFAGRIRRKK